MDKKLKMNKPEVTILMPCLNEAETIATCIKKAKKFLKENSIKGEILISDNGSTDDSIKISKALGARVIIVKEKGYGSALMAGIRSAEYEFIIMGDADDSYDFTEILPFVEKLSKGYELVMGNRFKGGIKSGAMPPLHKYLGNPVLSGLGKLFFRSPINDFHSGLRAFKKTSVEKLDLRTTGMEFASEMVVKATLFGLKITEVPVVLYPDGRSRKPHLRSWRDGWRHLRFLLLFSPKWTFLYPGLFLTLFSLVGLILIFIKDLRINNISFSVNTMIFLSSFLILGINTISLSLFTSIYGVNQRILPPSKLINNLLHNNFLEKGVILGIFIVIMGALGAFYSLLQWKNTGFGSLESSDEIMKIVIVSTTLLLIGIQVFFMSFFTGVLQLSVRK